MVGPLCNCAVVPQLKAGSFQIHQRNARPTERLAPERDKKRTTLDNADFPKHVDLLPVAQEMVHWCSESTCGCRLGESTQGASIPTC